MDTPKNPRRAVDEHGRETVETILARIDAGIRDADAGRFATEEQVQAEFARWRGEK